MFVKHYNLTGRPFQLTPDPRFYFESATHRKAMSYLGYGLAQGEGFIVITGDIGAGKTTLVGHLMATIDPQRLVAVKIAASEMDGDTALRLAAHAFGIETDGVEKAHVLSRLEAFMHHQARAGRRSLLIIDEAQTLSHDALEAMRMLSNFQLGGQSLVQIFLLGQPEFRDELTSSTALEQLRQRIIATHHLEPMQPEEVRPYVEHRLKVVGWTGNPAIEPAAFDRLGEASCGVPRVLNTLAQNAMQRAAQLESGVLTAAIVEAICAERETVLAPATAVEEARVRAAQSIDGARDAIRTEVGALKATVADTVGLTVQARADVAERLSHIEQRLAQIEARLDEYEEKLGPVLSRVGAVEEGQGAASIAHYAA
jgi:general secretion pathway protein A